ncbi:MAG: hypothetical protein J4452_04475 [Candidatus Aenigmarchaeota archaeon]|nr:hypothetical protein [Candidatus Aenigmarchaeota archaeon]
MKKFLLFVSIVFLISVNSVFAQNWDISTVTEVATNVFGIPQEWLTAQKLIFNVIIPFLALMAVCLGMLKQLRIFPRAQYVEVLLAFLMAFSTLPLKWFVIFVTWSLGAMGVWAYIIFFVLFVFGSLLFGIMRGRGYVGEFNASMAFYKDVNKELDQIRQKRIDLERRGPGTNPDAYVKEMQRLEIAEQKWHERLKAWRDTH